PNQQRALAVIKENALRRLQIDSHRDKKLAHRRLHRLHQIRPGHGMDSIAASDSPLPATRRTACKGNPRNGQRILPRRSAAAASPPTAAAAATAGLNIPERKPDDT